MTRQDAVLLASRTLGVLLMVWALVELSYLPARIYSFLHFFNVAESAYNEYMRHLELVNLCFVVTRFVGFALFSRLLLKGGPDMQDLFLPSSGGIDSQG